MKKQQDTNKEYKYFYEEVYGDATLVFTADNETHAISRLEETVKNAGDWILACIEDEKGKEVSIKRILV